MHMCERLIEIYAHYQEGTGTCVSCDNYNNNIVETRHERTYVLAIFSYILAVGRVCVCDGRKDNCLLLSLLVPDCQYPRYRNCLSDLQHFSVINCQLNQLLHSHTGAGVPCRAAD